MQVYRKDLYDAKGLKPADTLRRARRERQGAERPGQPHLRPGAARLRRRRPEHVHLPVAVPRLRRQLVQRQATSSSIRPRRCSALDWYVDALTAVRAAGGAQLELARHRRCVLAGHASRRYIDAHSSAAVIKNPEKSKVVGKIAYRALAQGPERQARHVDLELGLPDQRGADRQAEEGDLAVHRVGGVGRDAGAHLVEVRRPGQALRASTACRCGSSPEFAAAMKDAGDNFIPAALESLEQDTDVDWRPRVPQWPAIGETMATAIQAALVGQKKPKEALDEAQARIAADPEGLTRRWHRGARRAAGRAGATLEAQERRFALALLAPALARAAAHDDGAARLSRLEQPARASTSACRGCRGFAGLDNYAKMGGDPRFWNSLALTVVYTASTVVLQVVDRPVARAAGAADPARAGRAARRGDPADRARAGRRRPVLAHAGAGARLRPRRPRDARARPRQPQLARRSAARADLGDRDPHLAVDAVRVPRAAGDARDAAARRLRSGAPRPRQRLAALPPHHAAADPPGDRDGRHPAHDDGAVGVRRDLRGDRRRPGLGDRDPEPLRVPHVVHRAEPRLRRVARDGAAGDHARDLVRSCSGCGGRA